MQLHNLLTRMKRIAPAASLLCASIAMSSISHAEGYLGKVCLSSTVTERESGPVTEPSIVLAYEANHLGGGTYALSGSVNTPEGPFIFTGFGHQAGSILYMNITSTQSHTTGWRDTAVQQAQLNLTNFTGTFYENGRDYNPGTGQWDNRYTAGKFSKTACP